MVEPIVRGEARVIFGEGPLWDYDQGCLYWVDLDQQQLLSYHPKSEQVKKHQLPAMANGVVKYTEDELILLMTDGLYIYHLIDETITPLLKPEGLNERILLNDGKCDPEGRIWAGSADIRFRDVKESENHNVHVFTDKLSCLYRIDKNLNTQILKDQLVVSNGLDWDPARNIFYHVDSEAQSIYKYDYDPESGDIFNQEIVYTFEDLDGFPDGMTIDKEGMLYVALFKAGPVASVTPKHGVIAKIDPLNKNWVDSIIVPTSHVTSCCFGGEDLKTLFITTALAPLPESERANQPLAGRLFSVDLEVGGYKATPFNQTNSKIVGKM